MTASLRTASLRTPRVGFVWWVRIGLAAGVAASVFANAMHAEDDNVARAIAAWAPLAFFAVVEFLSRMPAAKLSPAALFRFAAAGVVGGVAAWISYWHMVAVADKYGEDSPHLLPLSVDGLIVVTSMCLYELKRREAKAAGEAVPDAKASHPAFTACPFCGGDAISLRALRAHIDRRHPAAVSAPVPVVERPPRLARPPAPAPVARPARSNRKPTRQVNSDMQATKDEYARRNIAGERAADLAKEVGKSTRTVELWTQDYRKRFPSGPVMETPTASPTGLIPPPSLTVLDAQTNGHRPEVEVTP